jgi:hypothetical protein
MHPFEAYLENRVKQCEDALDLIQNRKSASWLQNSLDVQRTVREKDIFVEVLGAYRATL